MTDYDITWRTLDFRPVAEHGWRALYFAEPTGWLSQPLAGWLIEEEFEGETPSGDRRVVAAVVDHSEPEPVTECSNFWLVLDPNELDPTPEVEARAREEKKRTAERVAAKRTKG